HSSHLIFYSLSPPPPRSTLFPYTTLFRSLRVLRCFSSPGLPRACARSSTLRPMGLPHSEILGSQLVCSSPRLIAAYHVLHRLPRSEEHTSELQSRGHVVCRLLLEKKTRHH